MLLKSKNTFLLKYGTLTVHFNRDTKVFLKWKYFRTDFGTRMLTMISSDFPSNEERQKYRVLTEELLPVEPKGEQTTH